MSKIEEVINQRTGNTEVFLNGRRLDDFDDHTAIQLEILKNMLDHEDDEQRNLILQSISQYLGIGNNSLLGIRDVLVEIRNKIGEGEDIDLSPIEELLLQILEKTGEVSFDDAVQTIIVENNNLTNQLKEAESTINKLNADLHILLVNKKKLEEDLRKASNQLKETRTSLTNTIQQKNELSKELNQCKQDNEQLKESSRKQSKQIAELKSSNSTKDLTIKRLQERVNELASEDLAKENNELRMKVARMDNELYTLKCQMNCAASRGWNDAIRTFRGC